MGSSNAAPKTWVITGCSSGFGLHLARAVVKHGHNVIATSRNPSRTPELVKEIESSGRGKWLALDVLWSAEKIQSAMNEAKSAFGRLDVVVNNVGWSVLGAAEDIQEDAAKEQFEANFWGAIRVTKAALPILREQQSGTIVQISSVAGLSILPSGSIYSASKFALEAWSEGLAQEVGVFGIRVLLVEPGMFRTNFLASTASTLLPLSEPYKDHKVLNGALKFFEDNREKQPGDAAKAAERIFEVVERNANDGEAGKIEKLRLILGKAAYDRVQVRMKQLSQNYEDRKEDALGLDFDP